MLQLEALAARHGDALLLHYGSPDDPKLIVIDGGPGHVYQEALRPRLDELKDEHNLRAGNSSDAPLPIELLMVSHIDDDHINGVLDLFEDLDNARADDTREPPYDILTLWHNAFDDIVDNRVESLYEAVGDETGEATAAAAEGNMPADFPLSQPTSLVVASVRQGRKLQQQAMALAIEINTPFDDLVVAPPREALRVDWGDGLRFVVLGPRLQRVEELQRKWDKELKRLKLGTTSERAQAAAYIDKSAFNLASVVVLAEAEVDGVLRRLLLTGDARGDDILEGLENAKLVETGGRIHVDLLKLPHHGSDRNIDLDFFQRITADHYVVSGDGRHHNPELHTFELLSEARGDAEFTLHLTYREDRLDGFFEAQKAAGKKYRVVYRDEDALGITVGWA